MEAWVVQVTKKKHVAPDVGAVVVAEAVVQEVVHALVLRAASGVPELLVESRAAAEAERGACAPTVRGDHK